MFYNCIWELDFKVSDPYGNIKTLNNFPILLPLFHNEVMLLTMGATDINKIGAAGGIKYLVKRKR